ncbi:hypothetical protein DAI22_03g384601 [Oryza sativa Japonica Group]|nr:hypothetical protein DAI22_03g384601 [Oryza sativa Japonica Group]
MALKIKHAVETVQRNKEDCLQIRRRVMREHRRSWRRVVGAAAPGGEGNGGRGNVRWEKQWPRRRRGTWVTVGAGEESARGGSSGGVRREQRWSWRRVAGVAAAAATAGAVEASARGWSRGGRGGVRQRN